MEKRKLFILIVTFAFVLALIWYLNPGDVQKVLYDVIGIDSGAVSLEIKGSDKRVEIGDEFSVEIYVTSRDDAINAVGYEIAFDDKLVEVISTSSEGSICELFPEDIIEGNSVRYGCGLPTPGFIGKDGLVSSIQLKAVGEGSLELVFGDNTQVLANDGLGTDLLSDADGAEIVIKPV